MTARFTGADGAAPAIDRHDFLRGLGLLAALALAPAARAEAGEHAAHGARPPATPATEGYQQANMRMHAAMDIEYTDNADVDFARAMIAHHQGAIDMANVMLRYGEDPELRQLAEEVIAAQQAEIAFLTAWLERNA
jgi:uncharacterized protein (DUF305 family)